MTKERNSKSNSVGRSESHAIQIFNHERFGQIRTMTDERGEVLFVGKDVAEALGYSNPSNALQTHVDKEDKTTYLNQVSGSNYMSKTLFINESGLYSLVLSSKLPQAKMFKRWVTSEVLPQIRMTGGYIPTHDGECERLGVRVTEQRLLVTEADIVSRSDEIRRGQIADENADADGCYSASEVAFMLEMPVKELNKRLVAEGVQFWNGGRYKLTSEYEGNGYAQDRAFHYYGLDGEKKERRYLVWTPQGLEFIRSLIKGKGHKDKGNN